VSQRLKARLPAFLKYKTAGDLVRLGKGNDGGYLVSRNDVDESEILLSFGVEYDWSFEEDFVGKRNLPVFAYDASVKRQHFLKRAVKALRRFKFRQAADELQKWGRFKVFFKTQESTYENM